MQGPDFAPTDAANAVSGIGMQNGGFRNADSDFRPPPCRDSSFDKSHYPRFTTIFKMPIAIPSPAGRIKIAIDRGT